MKKIIFLFIILILITTSIWLGVVYLNKVFIPQKLRPLLAEKVSEQIRRRFEFDGLYYNLFTGFTLENIRIYDEPPNTDKLFLSIKKVQFNILFLPIIKSKNIIIPTIYIDSPVASIKYMTDKTLNIPLPEVSSQNNKGKFNIVITRIAIANGRCSIEDQTKQPYFEKQLDKLNTRLYLSLPRSIKISAQAIIENKDKTISSLSLKGTYNLEDKSFNAESRLKDIPLNEYKPYLANLPITLISAQVKEAEILSSNQADLLTCRFSLSAKDIAFTKDNLKAQGNLSSKGDIEINQSSKLVDYQGDIDLAGVNLEGIPVINKVANINGRVNFSNERIKIALFGRDLKLNSEFNLRGKNITISYLDTELLNSELKLKGSVNLKESSVPVIGLDGSILLALEDIKEIGPRFGKSLTLPDLQGSIKATFLITGPVNKGVHNLDISLNGGSNQIIFERLRLTDILLSYNQKDSLGEAKFSSKTYNGNLNLSAGLDLTGEDIAYNAAIDLKGLKLAQLKQDTPLKDKDISGQLNASASLTGMVMDISKLNGQAQMKMSDGNLWELDLFKGLGELLSLSSFKRIIFKEAAGDFLIKGKNVFTDNLTFSSDKLNLSFGGNFDFSGNLNLDVLVNFSDELKKDSKKIEQLLTSIFTEAQKYISVKITGTFKKPQYKIVPRVVKDLVEGLFDILKAPQQ